MMGSSQFTIFNLRFTITPNCTIRKFVQIRYSMRLFLISYSLFLIPLCSSAQIPGGGSIHGNFEADAQYYRPDSLIGEPTVPQKMLMNSFVNFIYQNNDFSAGLRYESYLERWQL